MAFGLPRLVAGHVRSLILVVEDARLAPIGHAHEDDASQRIVDGLAPLRLFLPSPIRARLAPESAQLIVLRLDHIPRAARRQRFFALDLAQPAQPPYALTRDRAVGGARRLTDDHRHIIIGVSGVGSGRRVDYLRSQRIRIVNGLTGPAIGVRRRKH